MATPVEDAIAINPALILQRAGITPDPWQRRALMMRHRRVLLNCSRQAGKSTAVAAMAIDETAISLEPEPLVLIVSPSERQSKESLHTVLGIYDKLRAGPRVIGDSTTQVEFANGGRIFALPSKEENIRGFSKVRLIIIDEAARVSDDLYYAVRAMLAVSGGRLACLSTPNGKRGFYYEEWSGDNDWDRVRITADQCPRISAKFLAQEKRALPAAWYRQEYFCEFSEAEGALFSYDDVQRAMDSQLEPLFPQVSVPAAPADSPLSTDLLPLF